MISSSHHRGILVVSPNPQARDLELVVEHGLALPVQSHELAGRSATVRDTVKKVAPMFQDAE